MLASAYVVGRNDGPGAALLDVAREAGFVSVQLYAGPGLAERQAMQTPLLFFLFATADDIAPLKRAADEVRFSPGRRVRFSPLVYFAESASLETARAIIDMGFDDIITPPFNRARVTTRLRRLVDRLQVYRETPSYLGPERGQPDRGQHRRLEIVRTAKNGVSVLRDEMRRAGQRSAA